MRYYEWKAFRDKTVRRLLLKSYDHELYHDVIILISDLDRAYRFYNYINGSTIRIKRYQRQVNTFDKIGLDKKWLEHDINSKISYLKDLLVLMKLGS